MKLPIILACVGFFCSFALHAAEIPEERAAMEQYEALPC